MERPDTEYGTSYAPTPTPDTVINSNAPDPSQNQSVNASKRPFGSLSSEQPSVSSSRQTKRAKVPRVEPDRAESIPYSATLSNLNTVETLAESHAITQPATQSVSTVPEASSHPKKTRSRKTQKAATSEPKSVIELLSTPPKQHTHWIELEVEPDEKTIGTLKKLSWIINLNRHPVLTTRGEYKRGQKFILPSPNWDGARTPEANSFLDVYKAMYKLLCGNSEQLDKEQPLQAVKDRIIELLACALYRSAWSMEKVARKSTWAYYRRDCDANQPAVHRWYLYSPLNDLLQLPEKAYLDPYIAYLQECVAKVEK